MCQGGSKMTKEELYNQEFKYVYKKYLDTVDGEVDFEEVPGRPCEKAIVKLNGKNYDIYKYDFYEVLLVPKRGNLFDGDFEDIIRFSSYESAGFNFSIINKENGTIKIKDYYYATYFKNGYPRSKYKYTEINDEDNILFRDFLRCGYSYEEFIQKEMLKNMNISKTICATTRLEHGDKKIYVSPFTTSLTKKKRDYDDSEYLYIKSDKPLIEISEEMVNDKLNNNQIKTKKKND